MTATTSPEQPPSGAVVDPEGDARVLIAVRPASAFAARPRLVASLEAAFPVRLRPWSDDGDQVAGQLVLADGDALLEVDAQGHDGVPTLVLSSDARAARPREEIRLADAEAVDARVRGIVLSDALLQTPLAPAEGREDVLADAASGPAWTRSRGYPYVERVRAVLPELDHDEVLYSLLSRRAIAAVALIGFLRAVSAPVAWEPPPLRAAFVFDDPNLRRPRYGHLDYRQLVAHADAHGYHAAMAMIPLDAGRASAAAAALFRERRDRLSVVFHGNDHVKEELLAPVDDRAATALIAQALRRVERFERRTGVPVDRVMMPPHGRCSERVSRALGALGFDALSAIHPLPWTASRPSEPLLVAWRAAEFVGGCAVVPRIPLTSSVADIALRALLDHPLIVYGHHEDVAGGLEPLADAAARVNRVGDVEWTSVGRIVTGGAAVRVLGDRAVVRPHARRVCLDVAAGARTITVEAPQDALGPGELVGWSLAGGPAHAFGADAELVADGPVELRLHGPADRDPARVPLPRWTPWPKLRRGGTELRDRAVSLRAVRRG